MKRVWLLAVLIILPTAAWADVFFQTVSVECDKAANRLIIEHHGAYNEDGSRLVKHLGRDQWDLRSLLGEDNGPKEIKRFCVLRDMTYVVTISGIVWSRNYDETARVTVSVGEVVLFDHLLQGISYSEEVHTVITRIMITGGAEKPEISTTTYDPY